MQTENENNTPLRRAGKTKPDGPLKKSYRRLRAYIKRQIAFFRFEVWFAPSAGQPFYKRAAREIYKTVVVTVKKTAKDGCLDQSSALSYYTALAIVPVLAMVFGFAGGFGFENAIQAVLAPVTSSDMPFWNQLFEFVQNFLQKTNSGIIGGTGLIILLWIIITVLTRIEVSLNTIWEIRKARRFLRKATDYITLMILTPMLLYVAMSARTYLGDHLNELVDISFFQSLVRAVLGATPFLSTVFLICMIYLILPNRKIPAGPVLISSIITTICFIVFQALYIRLQKYMTGYNVVYGSFAALPLFLIWLRISWLILLVGAELSFSIYRRNQYIFETDYRHLSEFRRKIYALEMTSLLVKQFDARQGGMNVGELARQIGAPRPYLYRIAQELTATGILSCIFLNDDRYTDKACYQPAFDTHRLHVSDVLSALDRYDYNEDYHPENSEAYVYFEQYLDALNRRFADSDADTLVRDFKW